jgi:hypothetical protein
MQNNETLMKYKHGFSEKVDIEKFRQFEIKNNHLIWIYSKDSSE